MGCNQGDRNAAQGDTEIRNEETARDADRDAGPAVTLTGCLQKQDKLIDRFVLAEANNADTPSRPAGSGASVEREQMKAAMHSYSLRGAEKDLDLLVGKQVKITGIVEETSKLADSQPTHDQSADRDRATVGTTGNDRTELDESDLARVTVQSVQKVSDVCGDSR